MKFVSLTHPLPPSKVSNKHSTPWDWPNRYKFPSCFPLRSASSQEWAGRSFAPAMAPYAALAAFVPSTHQSILSLLPLAAAFYAPADLETPKERCFDRSLDKSTSSPDDVPPKDASGFATDLVLDSQPRSMIKFVCGFELECGQ